MTRPAYTLLAFPLMTTSLTVGVEAATSPADRQQYLTLHNNFRALHGAAPLTWNDTLAAVAQTVVDTCVFEHSYGGYGENLAVGTGDDYDFPTAFTAWTTDEAPLYNPDFPQPASHFTQVVWKATQQVGCAVKDGCTGIFGLWPTTFYACEYSPPGNVVGLFTENVQP